eukprot:gnl/MRDRNA2_/MRDRNA2_80170_c0_seq2.p1 gnl/MRDRNA2_/MRDRNA2_80170_c0~~gnl/MRDRNA2_/MRDRNA2_80170_c0_seq2.p1  ORF type:complete len:400 (-),score=84.42 gnl/MRDRNA2_/MRDRNA2_80170_c0_seq2:16-1215(-)
MDELLLPDEMTDEEALQSICTLIEQKPHLAWELVQWLIPDFAFGATKCLMDPAVRFTGTIKSFAHTKGYGFVTSPQIQEQFGSDVFCHSAQLGSFNVGDTVDFAVLLNKEGKPQAFDLVPLNQQETMQAMQNAMQQSQPRAPLTMKVVQPLKKPSPQLQGVGAGQNGSVAGKTHLPPQLDVATLTSQRYIGTMKSFSESSGFGFIACPDLFQIYGRDVFVHSKQCEGFAVGSDVSFSMILNKSGFPQAVDLSDDVTSPSPGSATESLAKGGALGKDDQGRDRYVGVVKSFSPKTGFGFISCPDLFASFGRDTFVHHKQVEGFNVGDTVAFTQVFNKEGHPQAIELQAYSDDAAATGNMIATGDKPSPGPQVIKRKVDTSAGSGPQKQTGSGPQKIPRRF